MGTLTQKIFARNERYHVKVTTRNHEHDLPLTLTGFYTSAGIFLRSAHCTLVTNHAFPLIQIRFHWFHLNLCFVQCPLLFVSFSLNIPKLEFSEWPTINSRYCRLSHPISNAVALVFRMWYHYDTNHHLDSMNFSECYPYIYIYIYNIATTSHHWSNSFWLSNTHPVVHILWLWSAKAGCSTS